MKKDSRVDTASILGTPLLLTPTVQTFAWGRPADKSLVWKLAGMPGDTRPHAELWIGAHPKSPSLVDGISLTDVIKESPAAVLGNLGRFGDQLPFLFKILSVGSALSIQAHPNAELATELNRRDPANYPDANHKPEMGIAISVVTLLYGFRSLAEIRTTLHTHPELAGLLTPETSQALQKSEGPESELIRKVYTEFVRAPVDGRIRAMQLLEQRIGARGSREPHDRIFMSVVARFGHSDIGLCCLYLLNFCTLQPKQGFYIGPNLPHAYLDGELVEIMANSDNVVRAGLTTKFQDLETLIGMLEFAPAAFTPLTLEKTPGTANFYRYRTPAEEFEIQVTESANKETLNVGGRAELLFCLSGSGSVIAAGKTTALRPGTALLMPASLPSYSVDFGGGALYRVVVPRVA